MEPMGEGWSATGGGLATGRLGIDMGGAPPLRGRRGRGELGGLDGFAGRCGEGGAGSVVCLGGGGGSGSEAFRGSNLLSKGGGAGRALENRDRPGVLGVLTESVSIVSAELRRCARGYNVGRRDPWCSQQESGLAPG